MTPLGYVPDRQAITHDIETLAAMERSSARAGEQASAAWVAQRLEAAGVPDVWRESFRYQRGYWLAHGAHAVGGLIGALRGGAFGALLAASAWISLEDEVSGRRQWVRRFLPAGRGVNVIGRIPARGRARQTIVLVAHHDAANTGLVWHPRVVEFGGRRHLRRRAFDPFMGLVQAGFGLVVGGSVAGSAAGRRLRAGVGWALRASGSLLLGAGFAADADVARSETVPGASDNASGVAVMLDLSRALAREPFEDVEVLIVATGCEEAGMGGMASFLARHGERLRQRPSFVIGLDTLGAGRPIVARAEGAMSSHSYVEDDLRAVREGAALSGLAAPEKWRLGAWTDPILAVFAGLPAVSLLSIGPGYFPGYHHPSDTPDRVRWESVEECARIAAGTVAAVARR